MICGLYFAMPFTFKYLYETMIDAVVFIHFYNVTVW